MMGGVITDYAIKGDNITVKFNLARERTDTLKEKTLAFLHGKRNKEELFCALEGISFSIEKGEAFAIVGVNGCGKSTLLKTIAGILRPTEGRVTVSGTIAPLIELGAGFDAELTARENIFLNGAVLGYSRTFMKDCFNDIIAFSELGEFIDVPLKNYSSGMYARLGFSIATMIKPEILIVDEILAVGDAAFQEKCENKMRKMISGGTTLVLVSHDAGQVRKMCNRAMWLSRGKIQMIDDADKVTDKYLKEVLG